MTKRIAVLSGAGVSAESGIKTFRDADGLWEGYDVMQVASFEGWQKDMSLVLDFYNQRRRQLKEVSPNNAHLDLAKLEQKYHVDIVTQNVDNLHERAGSSNIIHLHGELNKVRSTIDESLIYDWMKDLKIGDLCERGSQLRPHIVWFGEMVPLLDTGATLVNKADIIIIIGTSLQVYPAAGLISYAEGASIYYIDPNPQSSYELSRTRYNLVKKTATQGMEEILDILM